MNWIKETIVINTNTPILGFANRYSPRTWDRDTNQVDDLLSPDNPNSAESLAFAQTNALLCSRWESYGLTEIWEMADNSYFNIIFTTDANLLTGSDAFTRKSGEKITVGSPPKSCYSMKNERNNQFSAYQR